jgi:hypothetical protein
MNFLNSLPVSLEKTEKPISPTNQTLKDKTWKESITQQIVIKKMKMKIKIKNKLEWLKKLNWRVKLKRKKL